MVMKKNVMVKNLSRSIRRSLTRYIAIVSIIALGAGLFVGLLSTKTDMMVTAQSYMDSQNMFDLRLLNTYGWTDQELEEIRQIDGIADAEGTVIMDVIGSVGEDEKESVYQLYNIPDSINKVYLLGGRMPRSTDECLVDANMASEDILGKTFYISENNEQSTLDSLNKQAFTVVGIVSTPLFMDLTRGATTLGNGSVAAFIYVPDEAFSVDYYTQIDITVKGDYEIYTDRYHDDMETFADKINGRLQQLADGRFHVVKQEAQQAYEDGLKEYEEGLKEYEQGKADVEKELSDALIKLQDAQLELEENEKLIQDAEQQIADGKKTIEDNRKTLEKSVQLLAKTKADTYKKLAESNAMLTENYKTVNSNLQLVNDGLLELENGLSQINSGITQLQSGITQLDTTVSLLESMLGIADMGITNAENALQAAVDAGMDAAVIQRLQEELNNLKAEKAKTEQQVEDLKKDRETYQKQLEDLEKTRDELLEKQSELTAAKSELQSALATIEQGFVDLENGRVQADMEFAAAEAELTNAQLQLDNAQRDLEEKERELKDGKQALEEGRKELEQGWTDYEEGKLTAETELADAWQKLVDGKQELDDAYEQISSMDTAQVYALDRNTNVGYVAVNNNSDIVSGVSRVFPVFFLLVAALICITTMTRMVEEERTQIGTLKALGYSNIAIVAKYLLYAGSAAIVGCALGLFVGSIVFPKIIWHGYSLILRLKPELDIVFDIPLCLLVTGVYTLVVCLVTWNCCRISLKEVPAELIRPKAPTTGKKLFFERFRVWEKLSFLNKVMFRNMFRYRQRLLMMLLGVGGCTALLVTGFGFGDSIMDVVSYQFEEVTVYDMSVQFTDGKDQLQREEFILEFSEQTSAIGFAHQSSVELTVGEGTKSVYMIVPEGDATPFLDLHQGNTPLAMPGEGETVISSGVAEMLDIHTGDRIILRNSDMRQMELAVSGIFDNNVYNYAIVDPMTLRNTWGSEPEYNMAYMNTAAGIDAHELSADISALEGVMGVMVCKDLADQVGGMLDALNVIVVTIVICAALLAVIVLYNLTNINITERLREVATIKVLGFTSTESAMYVFKENLLLSAMGALLGLGGGKLLLDFVMDQVKIDMVWFQSRVTPLSLLFAILITLLMAVLVDFILYFKLERINMAEALKPVE